MTDSLVHFGVKGMKWGVRRDTSTSGTAQPKRMSKGKKIAIGVGASAAILAGTYATSRILKNRSEVPLFKATGNAVKGYSSTTKGSDVVASFLAGGSGGLAEQNVAALMEAWKNRD